MIEAKEIFCYLYGITDTNNRINLNGEATKNALDYMELMVSSLMLRRGLLLSKDNKRIVFKDEIKSSYDYKTGKLTSIVMIVMVIIVWYTHKMQIVKMLF